MRTLEIILFLVLLARILAPLFRTDRWIEWISVAALGVMALHLIFEGYRWQMIPLYGITIGMGIFSLWRLTNLKSGERELSMGFILQIGGGLLILGIAVIPPILLPVPTTPKPTGPHKVGTMTIMLVDKSREELYSKTAGEPRAIMVRIWYPAEPDNDAKPAAWLDHLDVMGPAIAKKLDLPSFFLDHVKYSHAHAAANAPLSRAEVQYPILLLSHGWGGFKEQNTYQVEELASHGYIVAAPDHTYGAVATVFPDGKVALNNLDALPTNNDLSDAEFLMAVQLLGDQWAGDLSFILDSLADSTRDAPAGQLANRLDFTRIGALGHSTGGGAAIQFCATDSRCKAALGMDPYMDPVAFSVLDEGLSQPYLAMFSDVWAQDRSRNNGIFENFSKNSSGDRFRYYIEKTDHYDFTDMPAFSPLAPHLGLKGPLDGEQALKIINTYTLAFFNRYFKGDESHLLEHPSPKFPELIFQH